MVLVLIKHYGINFISLKKSVWYCYGAIRYYACMEMELTMHFFEETELCSFLASGSGQDDHGARQSARAWSTTQVCYCYASMHAYIDLESATVSHLVLKGVTTVLRRV